MIPKNTPPISRRCSHCGKDNPLKAYCCIHCFKELNTKIDLPWWRIYIRPSWQVTIVLVVFAALGIITVKHWLENIEAQVSMNFKGDEYNVSVVADKKKKESAQIDITQTEISTDSTK